MNQKKVIMRKTIISFVLLFFAFTAIHSQPNAGPDLTVCKGQIVYLAGASCNPPTGAFWTTSGDGYFANPNTINAEYFPSINDYLNGFVYLTLHLGAQADTMRLSFFNSNVIFPNDTAVYSNQPFTLCAYGGVNYFWEWDGGNNYNGQCLNTTTAYSTFYKLHVTDMYSCNYIDTIWVNVLGQGCSISANVNSDFLSCDSVQLSAYGMNGFNHKFNWYLSTGDSIIGRNAFEYKFNNPGEYSIEVYFYDSLNPACHGQMSKIIKIDAEPLVAINITPYTSSKYGFSATITPNPTGQYKVEYWYFGDGNRLYNVNPAVHNYTDIGTFPIELKVVHEMIYNCYYTYLDTVVVTALDTTCPLIAYFTLSISDSSCFARNTNLVVQGTSNYNAYLVWGDGDTTIANGQYMLSHTYAGPGTYAASFYVEDIANPTCSFAYDKSINITPNVYGEFTYNVVGNTVHFHAVNLSGGSGNYNIMYDFGDAYQGFNPDEQHTYTYFGQYIVTMTVHDTYNNFCKYIYVDTINIVPACNLSLSWNIGNTSSPTSYDGWASVIVTQGYAPYHYLWNTGDTTSLIDSLPIGNYSCTVTDFYNCQQVVNISIISNQQPSVFAGNDSWTCEGNAFSLFDATVQLSDSVEWTIISGSGYFDNPYTLNPIFYPTPGYNGNFTLRLTSFYNGNSLFDDIVITVLPGPIGSISASATTITEGDNVTLTATGGVSYYWPINNDTTSSITVQLWTPTYVHVIIHDSLHCTSTDSIFIDVVPAPQCNPYFEPIPDTAGNGVQFNSMNIGNGFSYFWDFGDGQFSTTANPYHVYSLPGNYIACLRIVNPTINCDTTFCTMVATAASPECYVYFTYQETGQQPGEVYFFFSGNKIAQLSWNFGDNQTLTHYIDSNNTIIHTFPGNGNYQVCVTSLDSSGNCFSYYCGYVTVGNACFANFNYTVDNDTLKLFPVLSDNVQTPIYYWWVSNGQYSDQANPKFVIAPGVYTVGLSIFDTTTYCSSHFSKDIIVGQNFCYADFAHFADSLNVYFYNNSRSMFSGAQGSLNYYWTFGDGGTSTAENPTYTYASSGIYYVSLTVRDAFNNCYSYKEKMVVVGDVECNPYFTFFADMMTSNNNVSFFSQPSNTTQTFMWNFGDGTYSNLEHPVHNYASSGNYPVTLTVFTQNGNVCSYTQNVPVGNIDCDAHFYAYVDSATLKANFSVIHFNSNAIYQWDFGDGGFSNHPYPNHTYQYPGYYNVSLSVYNPLTGCQDYFNRIMLIGMQGADCEADFYYYNDFNSNNVNFYDYSWGNIISWYWNFGDGSSSTAQFPSHTYANPGFYDVCLTVRNSNGIENMTCKTVYVGQFANNCYATFVATTDSINQSASFTDMSLGSIDSWYWNFGDGDVSTDQHPTHTYATTGYYMVELYVMNSQTNCFSYTNKLINVGAGNNGLWGNFGYIVDSTSKANQRPVTFKGTAFGDPARYAWNFGDGQRDSTTIRPTHIYDVPSFPYTYQVCLTVYDDVTQQSHTSCKDLTFDLAVKTPEKPVNQPVSLVNFPNPFSKNTTIIVNLAQNGNTELTVVDLLGNKVATLFNEYKTAGRHVINFSRNELAAGVYFLKLTTGNDVKITRMVIGE